MYIFCDGSVGNLTEQVKSGGWAYAITNSKFEVIHCDFGKPRGEITNSSKSEIEACYQALLYASKMHKNCKFTLYSDSQVLVRSLQGAGKRKSYRELWDKIEPLIEENFIGRLCPVHINSHTGANTAIAKLNSLVDRLAKNGMDNLLIKPSEN